MNTNQENYFRVQKHTHKIFILIDYEHGFGYPWQYKPIWISEIAILKLYVHSKYISRLSVNGVWTVNTQLVPCPTLTRSGSASLYLSRNPLQQVCLLSFSLPGQTLHSADVLLFVLSKWPLYCIVVSRTLHDAMAQEVSEVVARDFLCGIYRFSRGVAFSFVEGN